MGITLLEPANGAVVQQLTQKQIDFIRDITGPKVEEFDWANLKQKKDEYSLPLPVVFRWEGAEKAMLVLSPNANFSETVTYEAEGQVEVYNLLIGHTYYWYVQTEDEKSEVWNFTMDPMAPRLIMAGGLSNVRDIGGRTTMEGKQIRQGMIYRGCEMEFHHIITEDGIDVLANQLKIRTDLDIRFEAVDKIFQSALGAQVNFELIPCKPYGEFVEDKEIAGKIFRLFTQEEMYPFYIHCWGGADRTGTIILILCGILGVDDQALFEDYEFTSLSIWGNRSRKSELFMTLMTALDQYEGKNLSEKCRAFLLDCGLSQEEIETIRCILLQES